ncbi:MAG: hypothetical protein H7232_17015 [Aeromicrobium sp.]|nr:hypothetical protein [Burkholderiales bacterium]
MGTSFLAPVFRRVLQSQIGATIFLLVVALMVGGQIAAISSLIGGVAVIAGSLAYAFIVRPAKIFAVSGKRVLLRHIVAEFAKLSLVLGILFSAFAMRSFDGGWLLAGLICGLLAHWATLYSPQ